VAVISAVATVERLEAVIPAAATVELVIKINKRSYTSLMN
jgi:hypothetical protein